MGIVRLCYHSCVAMLCFFFFQAEDGIRDVAVTGVQTCALPIWMAAQFTLTRGREDRCDRAWIACATSSFPVPVSPRISTVDSVGATLVTRFSTVFNAALLPTMFSGACFAPFFPLFGTW